jgi:hypothetical protein
VQRLRRERLHGVQRTMRTRLRRNDRIGILIISWFERVRYAAAKQDCHRKQNHGQCVKQAI